MPRQVPRWHCQCTVLARPAVPSLLAPWYCHAVKVRSTECIVTADAGHCVLRATCPLTATCLPLPPAPLCLQLAGTAQRQPTEFSRAARRLPWARCVLQHATPASEALSTQLAWRQAPGVLLQVPAQLPLEGSGLFEEAVLCTGPTYICLGVDGWSSLVLDSVIGCWSGGCTNLLLITYWCPPTLYAARWCGEEV